MAKSASTRLRKCWLPWRDEATTAVPEQADDPVEKSPETVIVVEKEDLVPSAKKPNRVSNGQKPSWFRVRVKKLDNGKSKVSVNIPLGLVKFGLSIANRFSPELDGVDLDELNEMLQNDEAGILVDVRDEESNGACTSLY